MRVIVLPPPTATQPFQMEHICVWSITTGLIDGRKGI